MRTWLTEAVEAKGAKNVGGGIGLGQADIDIELGGCRYNISIRPLPARQDNTPSTHRDCLPQCRTLEGHCERLKLEYDEWLKRTPAPVKQ